MVVKAKGRRQKAEVRSAQSLAPFAISAFCLLPFAFVVAFPSSASADLVRLKNGRVICVESWQLQGEIAVLVLRDGGQM